VARALDLDAVFMERAAWLAERGRGRTTPNPLVGAVIVSRHGIVVGQGAHLEAGTPHAEVHAIEAAGERARGSTLYCTLEPCAHRGRTGPCVDRIVAAGITRVVAAVRDPNPRVTGGGFARLRAAGVQVEVGVGAEAAARQNAPFFTWAVRRRPFVVLKTAVSADGFVGRPDRRVKLTGPVADRWFDRQRAEIDALAVGSGTVLVDDPRLTTRGVFRYRPLTRVIFDRRGRVPATSRVFSTLASGPVIMLVSGQATDKQRHALARFERLGAIVERFDEPTLPAVMARLADRDIVTVLVEGGPTLQDALAAAGLVDRVQVVATPHRLGHGVAAPSLARSPRPEGARATRLGEDTLIEFDVHGAD
jgi:diaminohydroxyphosphoribosylaminopyrimidine deaminase/5-amino-6-(5-phosphoribosylamino)uracil reductase